MGVDVCVRGVCVLSGEFTVTDTVQLHSYVHVRGGSAVNLNAASPSNERRPQARHCAFVYVRHHVQENSKQCAALGCCVFYFV